MFNAREPHCTGRTISDFPIGFCATWFLCRPAVGLDGDRGSCDWRHFGRLAGFTSQRKERRLLNGRKPALLSLGRVRGCQTKPASSRGAGRSNTFDLPVLLIPGLGASDDFAEPGCCAQKHARVKLASLHLAGGVVSLAVQRLSTTCKPTVSGVSH
jgi:hypothetical protein